MKFSDLLGFPLMRLHNFSNYRPLISPCSEYTSEGRSITKLDYILLNGNNIAIVSAKFQKVDIFSCHDISMSAYKISYSPSSLFQGVDLTTFDVIHFIILFFIGIIHTIAFKIYSTS